MACLLGLLQTMTESHYRKLWELHLQHGSLTSSSTTINSSMGPQKTLQLHNLIYNFILLLSNLVTHTNHVFPKDWFLMLMVTNNIILTAMQELAEPILAYFTKGCLFDYRVSKARPKFCCI